MKKGITKLMAIVLAMVLLICGCGAGGNQATTGETTAKTENQGGATSTDTTKTEPTELKDMVIFAYTYMDIPDLASIQAVADELNKTMHPMGVNVIIEVTNASSFADEFTMKLASGESVDLCSITDNTYSNYVNNGALMPLDDLLAAYGQDLVNEFGGEDKLGWLLDAVKINGQYYSVPVLDNKFNWGVAALNKAMVDKYEIDTASITSYADLTPWLQKIYENEDTMKPIISGSQTFSGLTVTFCADSSYENLGDGIGVLLGENNWDVVNLYETEVYANFCKEMHEWFKAGYVSPDIATSGENADAYWKTGNAFSYLANASTISAESWAGETSRNTGVETVAVQISPMKATFLKFLNVIPATSKNPEGAMIFLNEIFTNKDLLTTFYYGVEGKDWNWENDVIVGASDSSWFKNMGAFLPMMYGNYYLPAEVQGMEPGTRQIAYEAMLSCDKNRSLGFYFDATNVSVQITAVQNVLNQYQPGLEYGILDPEVELPKFIDALKAAGIDDIIAEKQAQLDAWVAANGK